MLIKLTDEKIIYETFRKMVYMFQKDLSKEIFGNHLAS